MKEDQDLIDIIGEFDAGIFTAKIMAALKLVSLGVVNNGKKGNVTISLNMERIGDSHSVQIHHALKYCSPTKNGKTSEENTTSTPMYVDNYGILTISPQLQQDLFDAEKKTNVSQLRK